MADTTKQMERELIAQKVANIAGKASSISATSSASSILSAIADIKGNPNLSPSDLAMLSQVETQLLAEEKNKMIAAQAEIAEYFKQDMLNRANQLAEGIKELRNKVDDFHKKFEEDEKKLDENRKRREENNKIIDENPRSEEAKKARDENIKSLADDIGLVAKNTAELEKLDLELKEKKEVYHKIFGNTKDENLTPEQRKLKKETLEEIASIDEMLSASRERLVKNKDVLTRELSELMVRERIALENPSVSDDELRKIIKAELAKGPSAEELERVNNFVKIELQKGLSPSERHKNFEKFVQELAKQKVEKIGNTNSLQNSDDKNKKWVDRVSESQKNKEEGVILVR